MQARDSAQYSRFVGLEGLEVMTARWLERSFAPHMHDFYAVSLNYGGRGAFDCRNKSRDAVPGSCNLIAPGEMHTGHATSREGWTYRNLYIEPALMTKLLHSMDWRGPTDVSFKMPLVRDTKLAGRLSNVFASLGESNSLLQNEALLLSVIARLVSDHFLPNHTVADVRREHAAVVKVKDWLDAHPEQNVSLHSLAALAHLSPYYLVRVFHKEVGIPPHKYQMTVRINRARKLLRSGEPIAQVASRSGFCDQSHLNRCFKRTLGITPWEYARPAGRGGHRLAESPPAENLHRRASIDD